MKATTCLVYGWNLTRDELLRFKEWIITNLRLFGQRVILLIIPRTQILNTFLPYFDKRPMLFSLLCPNNEKAGHRGGREPYKWCRWKRENSFFDARQSRVGPRSELMTRYNEPHARAHKDTPARVRGNHRKHTSHVHNCARVRVWSKFATIVVVRARVQLFVSPLRHFGAWDRFNFGTIWLRAKHVIHSIGLNAIMWDLFWA